MTTLIQLAGGLQLALIPVNFIAPYKLRYAASLAGATPIVRNIFYVHAGYIVFVLAGLGALCLGAAEFLGSGAPLARWTCGYLAAFWAIRVLVQLFYYDREERRRNRALDVAFLSLFASLALVFAAAAAGGMP
ncbi:MAG: hypothetical protein FD180_3376 [Planctomycetota bacterium]|nr:MAG: hypothetical protein FD180_3376 [Planctomycetota bacterium]